MAVTEFISMFLLGLLGTGHCIGMCGPLVFAFPGSTGKFTPHLWYHAGRVGTYTFMGALIGGIGAGLVDLSGDLASEQLILVVWIQFGLSLVAAAFLFLFGMIRLKVVPEPQWMTLASPEKIPGMGGVLRSALASPKGPALLVLGAFTGFIPCGLSYAAFAKALPSGGIRLGAMLLMSFGLGTLPGLLLLGTGLSRLFQRYREMLELLAGVVMIAMAVRMLLKATQTL